MRAASSASASAPLCPCYAALCCTVLYVLAFATRVAGRPRCVLTRDGGLPKQLQICAGLCAPDRDCIAMATKSIASGVVYDRSAAHYWNMLKYYFIFLAALPTARCVFDIQSSELSRVGTHLTCLILLCVSRCEQLTYESLGLGGDRESQLVRVMFPNLHPTYTHSVMQHHPA